MSDTSAETTPQWAIIELMGHVRYGGLVCKDNMFGTAMLRVDVPQQNGTFVSQLVNPQSIYRITMADELLARAAADQGESKPMSAWQLSHLLPQPSSATPPADYAPDEDRDDYAFRP